MYALGFDIWPFPDIPGPSDWVKAIAGMFFDSQIGMLKFAIKLLFSTAPPPPGVVESDWFSYLLGSWTDLGINLLSLSILLTYAVLLLRLGKDFGSKNVKLFGSIVGMAVFIRGYYPLYAGAYKLSHGLSVAISDYFTGDGKDSLIDQLTSLVSPDDVIGQLVGFLIAWVITLVVAVDSLWLFVLMLVASLVYPVFLILRPVHRFFENVWHWLNAGIVSVFVSPPLMVLTLSICVAGISKSKDVFPAGNSYVGITCEIVALGLCAAIPALILWLAHKRSVEVWGRLDSAIEGAVDIRSNEPLTVREAENRITESHNSVIREVGTATFVASIDDKPGEPMSRRLADIAGTVAAATGHLEVAAMAQVVKSRIPDQPKEGGGVG
jgi:hypothetical protein